jgi:TetR/AcrR family transcriptional repressor of nem operon
MRFPAEDTSRKHEAILIAAASLFRSRGLSVNLRDIMQSAGLTHGAFYAHFPSKEKLIAECAERCVRETIPQVELAKKASDPAKALLTAYLSGHHRDHPGDGCAVAALGSEIARLPSEDRKGVTSAIRDVLDSICAALRGHKRKSETRRDAIQIYAMAVGSLILSRAVDDPDLSDEILKSTRTFRPES